MVIQCKSCETIIFSTYKEPFQECECGDILIDGSYDKEGNLLLSRYGWPEGDPNNYFVDLGDQNELVQ